MLLLFQYINIVAQSIKANIYPQQSANMAVNFSFNDIPIRAAVQMVGALSCSC